MSVHSILIQEMEKEPPKSILKRNAPQLHYKIHKMERTCDFLE